MRPDLAIIAELVNRNARVLDLGCGRGELLAHLQREKAVRGYGVEKDPDEITACVRAGVNVIEQDLNEGLSRFPNDSFDMVVMTETLQAVEAPDDTLDEMLRIGQECIVTFPNFGHWLCRLRLLTSGRMPIAPHIPYTWYDTPNIHLCTFRDFEQLCTDKGIPIIARFVVNRFYHDRPWINRFPNLFGTTAFYRLGRAV